MSSCFSSGYSFRICWGVRPLARSSMIRYTGMRVPFITGFSCLNVWVYFDSVEQFFFHGCSLRCEVYMRGIRIF